jgi:hypothetical protein
MMFDTALAMIAILATWIALFSVLAGLGLLATPCLEARRSRSSDARSLDPSIFDMRSAQPPLPEVFWLGFCAELIVLQLWHLVLPVNGAALAAVSVLGLIGLLYHRRLLWPLLTASWPAGRWPGLLLLLLICWTANRALGAADAFDDGLYHLAVVKWFSAYPIVPGLANLHIRYGFNNPSMLHLAALNVGPWTGRYTHVGNGLLVAVLFWQAIGGASRTGRVDSLRSAMRVYWLVLLIPGVVFAMNKQISGAGTDLPMQAMTCTAAGVTLEWLLSPAATCPTSRPTLAGVLWIAVACLKLSGAPLAVMGFALVVFVWIWRDRPSRPYVLTTCVRLALIGGVLIAPWMLRGIILSGYPLLPSAAMAVPVSWTVPIAEVRAQATDIAQSGHRVTFVHDVLTLMPARWVPAAVVDLVNIDEKGATSVTRGLAWFAALVITDPIDVVLPLGVALISLLLMAVFARRPPPRYRVIGLSVTLPLVSVVALVYWIDTAPDPRFGMATAWILCASAAALLFHAHPALRTRQAIRAFKASLALAVAGVIVHRAIVLTVLFGQSPRDVLPVVFSGSDHGFYPTPVSSLKTVLTDSGLAIAVPVSDGRVYSGPLMATPTPDAALRLRRPPDVSHGFRK